MNQAFSKNSENTTKRRYDFGFGTVFMAFITYRWAATIVQEGGQKPSEQVGTVLGLAVGFLVILVLFDYLLWRWQFSKAIRSALWVSAAIGSYATLLAWVELAHPVWSHIIGFVSTVLVFVVFYSLDNAVQRKQKGSHTTDS